MDASRDLGHDRSRLARRPVRGIQGIQLCMRCARRGHASACGKEELYVNTLTDCLDGRAKLEEGKRLQDGASQTSRCVLAQRLGAPAYN